MHTCWQQTTRVTLVSSTAHIPSFMTIGHCVLVNVYIADGTQKSFLHFNLIVCYKCKTYMELRLLALNMKCAASEHRFTKIVSTVRSIFCRVYSSFTCLLLIYLCCHLIVPMLSSAFNSRFHELPCIWMHS